MTLTAHETAQRAWLNGEPAAPMLADLCETADAYDAAETEIEALRYVMGRAAEACPPFPGLTPAQRLGEVERLLRDALNRIEDYFDGGDAHVNGRMPAR